VHEDLGVARTQLSTAARGTRGVGVGVLLDLREPCVQRPSGGTVHRLAVVGLGPRPGNVVHRPGVVRVVGWIGIVRPDLVRQRRLPQFDGIGQVGVAGVRGVVRRAGRERRRVTAGRVC
jgi:hypothetical protein